MSATWVKGEDGWMRLVEQADTAKPTDYPWDRAPDWAGWAATDSSGLAHWWAAKPVIPTDSWFWAHPGAYVFIDSFPGLAGDWQDSRRARPGRVADPETRSALHKDPVDKPSHYTQGGIECIDAIRAQLSEEEYRGYLRGNVVKYVWRYRGKNKVEDLMKAEVYLGWLMKLEGHSTDRRSNP